MTTRKKIGKALGTWARAFGVCVLYIVQSEGKIPQTLEEAKKLAVAAALSLAAVAWRALNPGDGAYGVGSPPAPPKP